MHRFASFVLFAAIGLACQAAASPSAPQAHQLPPVDAFTVSDAGPRQPDSASKSTASIARDVREPPGVAPLPPNLGPHPKLPPGPAYSPEGEPLRIEPAASAMGNLTEADRDFARRAGEINNAQIALGKLAVWRGGQTEVREFGQRMINTHMGANNALRTLLEGRNIPTPTGLDKDHQAARARLSKISGTQFDREYIRLQLQDHIATAQLFRSEALHGNDAWLRGWAEQLMPTLERDLQQIRELNEAVKPGV